MEYVDSSNPNHPCYGKTCEECDVCVFDQELFLENDKNNNKMINHETCKDCPSLIKNYIGESIQFNASCSRSRIISNGFSKPRLILGNTGPMVPIEIPEWCPKKRGVTYESMTMEMLQDAERRKALPSPNTVSTPKVNNLTYAEKKERLMKFPKRLTWDEIEEDKIYVIPKILSQSRKVIRVIIKDDASIRYSEIDEYGKESSTLYYIYPSDIEMVFITKLLNF